jgi:hypothetical protein
MVVVVVVVGGGDTGPDQPAFNGIWFTSCVAGGKEGEGGGGVAGSNMFNANCFTQHFNVSITNRCSKWSHQERPRVLD